MHRFFIFMLISLSGLLQAGHAQNGWERVPFIYPDTGYTLSAIRIACHQNQIHVLHANKNFFSLTSSKDDGKTWKTHHLENLRDYPAKEYLGQMPKGDSKTEAINKQWVKDKFAEIGPQNIGMAIDKNGRIHIAYWLTYSNNNLPTFLFYTHQTAKGKWKKELVLESSQSFNQVELGLDTQGNPILLYGGTFPILMLKENGNWKSIGVPQDPKTFGEGSSGICLAIDQNDRIHVGTQQIRGTFNYAVSSDQGKTWETDAIPPNGTDRIWFECDLNVDAYGRPHFTRKVLHDHLEHAWKDDGEWFFKTINADSGCLGELFPDPAGGMHVTYYPHYHDTYQNRVMHGYVDEMGEDWKTEVVTLRKRGGASYGFPAISSNGKFLYIAYLEGDYRVGVIRKPLRAAREIKK